MGERVEIGEQVWGASVDLKDGFHQFLNYRLAEWFLFDVEGVKASELNLREVIGGHEELEAVGADEFIWRAYGGMAMGWSWALWICHETVTAIMGDVGADDDVCVLDKHPVPALPGAGRRKSTTPTWWAGRTISWR